MLRFPSDKISPIKLELIFKSIYYLLDTTSSRQLAKMLHQIVMLSICSVALSLCFVSSSTFASRPNSVSYPQHNAPSRISREFRQANPLALPSAQHKANYQLDPITSQYDLNDVQTMQPAAQPSVYHSIIDRTDSSPIYNVSPAVQTSTATTGDLAAAAGHHHGHAHGKYYEYRAVPKKKTWKFGYKRGNHKHTISRHEHGKAGKHPHFKTKVKWHDKKSKGKGIHLWDYNHHDKKHYHHG